MELPTPGRPSDLRADLSPLSDSSSPALAVDAAVTVVTESVVAVPPSLPRLPLRMSCSLKAVFPPGFPGRDSPHDTVFVESQREGVKLCVGTREQAKDGNQLTE